MRKANPIDNSMYTHARKHWTNELGINSNRNKSTWTYYTLYSDSNVRFNIIPNWLNKKHWDRLHFEFLNYGNSKLFMNSDLRYCGPSYEIESFINLKSQTLGTSQLQKKLRHISPTKMIHLKFPTNPKQLKPQIKSFPSWKDPFHKNCVKSNSNLQSLRIKQSNEVL